MKKYFKFGFLAFIFLLLVGCNDSSNEPLKAKDVDYTSDGMTITMGKGFTKKSQANWTVYYERNDAIFMGVKETFDSVSVVNLSKDSTLDEYFDLIIKNAGETSGKLKSGNLNYFTYEREVSGTKYFYVGCVFKSHDAFWLFNFACLGSDRDTFEDEFIKWAKTIRFE